MPVKIYPYLDEYRFQDDLFDPTLPAWSPEGDFSNPDSHTLNGTTGESVDPEDPLNPFFDTALRLRLDATRLTAPINGAVGLIDPSPVPPGTVQVIQMQTAPFLPGRHLTHKGNGGSRQFVEIMRVESISFNGVDYDVTVTRGLSRQGVPSKVLQAPSGAWVVEAYHFFNIEITTLDRNKSGGLDEGGDQVTALLADTAPMPPNVRPLYSFHARSSPRVYYPNMSYTGGGVVGPWLAKYWRPLDDFDFRRRIVVLPGTRPVFKRDIAVSVKVTEEEYWPWIIR